MRLTGRCEESPGGSRRHDPQSQQHQRTGSGRLRSAVAAVLAVAGTRFDEDVVGPSPHEAVVLIVGAFAGSAQEGAGPDEAPVAIHFLSYLSAHAGREIRVMRQRSSRALGDGQRRVVEGVGTPGIRVRLALPALDRLARLPQ